MTIRLFSITICKFSGLLLALLTSLASSRDSRPKQEILDDLLEQARQVRSGEEAWGDSLSVQARQHQEKDAVDQRAGGKENEEVSFQAELLLRLNLLRANSARSNFVGSNFLLRGNLAGRRRVEMGRSW